MSAAALQSHGFALYPPGPSAPCMEHLYLYQALFAVELFLGLGGEAADMVGNVKRFIDYSGESFPSH